MVAKGYVLNNTCKARHAYKQTVYPGQKVSLEDIYKLVANRVPSQQSFVTWLKENMLPEGWEVVVETAEVVDLHREVLEAVPVVVVSPTESGEVVAVKGDAELPSLEYAPRKAIDKLTAKDIYNLRLKDNPQRVIGQITSIHKLRRALVLCKDDGRKSVLTRIIHKRIKKLNILL